MAIVGQRLTAPEAGWKRYDDNHSFVSYNGSGWLFVSSQPELYSRTGSYIPLSGATNSYIRFVFYGTKLRIIDLYWTNRVNNVNVTIDGVQYSYNPNNSTNQYQLLVFEKTDFPLGIHEVILTTNSTSGNFSIDAIDIDSDGELLHYDTHIPKSKCLLSNDGKYFAQKNEYVSLPAMTANTTGSFVASAIGIYQTYLPWKAFNNKLDADGNDAWAVSGVATASAPKWLMLKLDTPRAISKYELSSQFAFPARSPSTWKFQGSNDGVTFVDLDTQTGVTGWANGVIKSYTIPNKEAYLYYRIYITAGGSTYTCIGMMKMYESVAVELMCLDELNTQTFVDYGMDKGVVISLEENIEKKTFVSKSPTSLGSGKVFKQTIDTSKMPIRKIEMK